MTTIKIANIFQVPCNHEALEYIEMKKFYLTKMPDKNKPLIPNPGLSGFIKILYSIMALAVSIILTCCNSSDPVEKQDQISLRAFPGAEGFGSATPGGRGGKIIFVTNLNLEGEGSLRAACAYKGPRIVIFKVGGTIDITDNIMVSEPYLTIAGQTAPGDGICLKGAGIGITTHDVIIRGLRIRIGDAIEGENPSNRDALSINNNSEPPYNIIIDHCSFSWAIDETVQLWYPCHDITVQWCIISEGLYNSLHPKGGHSTGLLIGDYAESVSVHHNLFAHNNGRNPLMKGGTTSEVINNVIFNWGTWEATALSNFENIDATILCNILGNYYKAGPDNSPWKPLKLDDDRLKPGTQIYFKDNYGQDRMSDDIDDWILVDGSQQWKVDEPALPLSGLTISTPDETYETILNHAGANYPHYDAVDTRVIQDVKNNSGRIIDSQDEVGGWPEYKAGEAPVDSDNDGMPDAWETANELNPSDAFDAYDTDLSSEGYINLEVYINSLISLKE
jgi:pectate lyase